MVPTLREICRSHLEYMVWADNQLLGAVRGNMPERIEILRHIFMAERIWLARIEGTAGSSNADLPESIDTLTAEWADLHRRWLAWADAQTDWGRALTYTSLAGVEYTSMFWQIGLHVANHGSYHRGQVAAALRAAGFTPPSTDLILWYRLR